MQLKWARGLWLWAGVLGLFLILAILPLSLSARIVCVVGVLLAVLLGWLLAGRRALRQRQSALLAEGCVLPAADYRQPIVAVCGDGLPGLFGNVPDNRLALRITEQGCYVRVASVERLSPAIDYILANRAHWVGQLSACLVINPGEQTDNAVLAGQVQTFRQQIARIRRSGVALPVVLASYLSARGEGGWFTWDAADSGLSVREGSSHLPVTRWQRHPENQSIQATRLRSCVQVESLGRWLTERVLAPLSTSTPCWRTSRSSKWRRRCTTSKTPPRRSTTTSKKWSCATRRSPGPTRTATSSTPMPGTNVRLPDAVRSAAGLARLP